MQGIFGASLTSHSVAQGVLVLFAMHVVDIELHTESSLGCMAYRCCNQTALRGTGGLNTDIKESKEVEEQV